MSTTLRASDLCFFSSCSAIGTGGSSCAAQLQSFTSSNPITKQVPQGVFFPPFHWWQFWSHIVQGTGIRWGSAIASPAVICSQFSRGKKLQRSYQAAPCRRPFPHIMNQHFLGCECDIKVILEGAYNRVRICRRIPLYKFGNCMEVHWCAQERCLPKHTSTRWVLAYCVNTPIFRPCTYKVWLNLQKMLSQAY